MKRAGWAATLKSWLTLRQQRRSPSAPVAHGPSQMEPHAALRELLFADEPLAGVAGYALTQRHRPGAPWGHFAAAAILLRDGKPALAIQELRHILETAGLDSRFYLQAWSCMRELGERPDREEASRIRGLVIEEVFATGLELLSVYDDGTARILEVGDSLLGFDDPTPELRGMAERFLDRARPLVEASPADRAPVSARRPALPPREGCRISVLTPAGFHVLAGPGRELWNDPRAAPILQASVLLKRRLMREAEVLEEAEPVVPGPQGRRQDGPGGAMPH